MTLNNTTIGDILRASGSHSVTGRTDEVAVWKRTLSATEIKNIKENGVPKSVAKRQPLEIISFLSDADAAAAGDKLVLRWKGSNHARYSISTSVGDVSATTIGGAGSKEVTVDRSTTDILTATRGNESLSKSLAHRPSLHRSRPPGWHLLDNFENLTPGNLFNQSRWLGAEGGFQVIERHGNKAIGYDAGADLTAFVLNSHKVPESPKATLSFRVLALADAAEDPILPIALHVGLTERSIRFNGDFNQNVGPYLRVERLAAGGPVGAGATLTNVTIDAAAKIIRADLPADKSKPAYLRISPAVSVQKASIEGK